MFIHNEETARAWAASWRNDRAPGRSFPLGDCASNVRRYRDAAASQRGCAILCGDRRPTAKKGHEAAAAALELLAREMEERIRKS